MVGGQHSHKMSAPLLSQFGINDVLNIGRKGKNRIAIARAVVFHGYSCAPCRGGKPRSAGACLLPGSLPGLGLGRYFQHITCCSQKYNSTGTGLGAWPGVWEFFQTNNNTFLCNKYMKTN